MWSTRTPLSKGWEFGDRAFWNMKWKYWQKRGAMLKREIDVEVAADTWPSGRNVPPTLSSRPGPETIDMKEALIMFGTLTMPNLISPASPARFWAWLRYTIAISKLSDLRITMDFADLDPHQKAILSDDFGVAVSTWWLHQRLGGFSDIVDGRRFLLQFPHLLRRKKKTKAKVGPGKAPDFVIQDTSGLWHVLECKGTQSGRKWRDKFLKRALDQKGVVNISGRIRGERLAAGLAISNELDKRRTELRIVDPEPRLDVEIELDDRNELEIRSAAHRIAIARALGTVGLNEAAMEVWLPEEVVDANEFLMPSEIARLGEATGQRRRRASQQVRDRTLEKFKYNSISYEGRAFNISLPALGIDSEINQIEVRVGVNEELLHRIEDPAVDLSVAGDPIESLSSSNATSFETSSNQSTLTCGKLSYAELFLSSRP